MKIVCLSSHEGKVKKRYVGYSFLFLIFGPFYLIARFRLFSGIFLLMIYYYLLPIPGMDFIYQIIVDLSFSTINESIYEFLMFFRGDMTKFIGIGVVILFQFIVAFFLEGPLLKRYIKRKKLLPVTEDDARLLIYVHAANRKILLAGSTYSQINDDDTQYLKKIDVPYIIDNGNKTQVEKYKENEKRKQIEELNEIYRLGQINREEYEIRRARIINMYK